MLAAEATYCELEQEFQYELDHYEALHPGYDEYRFDLDKIEHDPYVLISILTAFHEGVFTIDEVQEELQMLFEKQYILTQTVEVEVRYDPPCPGQMHGQQALCSNESFLCLLSAYG